MTFIFILTETLDESMLIVDNYDSSKDKYYIQINELYSKAECGSYYCLAVKKNNKNIQS
jgi:hypothetical protein